MGAMDKFLDFIKLNNDDDDDYYDDYDDDYEEPAPRTRARASEETSVAQFQEEAEKPARKAVPQRQSSRSSSRKVANGMEVCVIKPTDIESSREITDTLLANRPVILNLEGLDVESAQRIIDFISGSCYAIRGNLQKISQSIFIVTPPSVDISGDLQEIFGGTGFDVPLHNN